MTVSRAEVSPRIRQKMAFQSPIPQRTDPADDWTKIWDKDAGDSVFYCNQMDVSDDSSDGTVLGGGDIKVHKG